MKLSICMMIKNEEKHLERCLNSLKPILNNIESELIIVDTGSTDRSVEIAQQHTKRLYFHEWNDDFSAMRNITLSYATGEWVFLVDGDEILEDATQIIEFINSKDSKYYNTVIMKVKNWVDEEENNFTMIASHRIFKKHPKLKYIGKIHNQIEAKRPIKEIDAILLHYGYIHTDEELMERKFQRTATILKKELEEEPENIYYIYQLAESYGMHKEYDKALEYAEKSYRLLNQKKLDKMAYLYVIIGCAKWSIKNMKYADAERVLLEVKDIASEYVDVQCNLGYSLFLQNRKKESIPYFEKYLDLVERFDELQSSKNLAVKHDSYGDKHQIEQLLGEIYNELELYEKSISMWKKYEEYNGKGKACGYLIKAFFELEKYNEIYEYYIECSISCEDYLIELVELQIEKNISNEKSQLEIAKLLEKENNQYGILNRVRKQLILDEYNCDEIDFDILDFDKLKEYYSDIFLYLIINKIDLIPLVKNLYEEQINKFMISLIEKGIDKQTIKTRIWPDRKSSIEMKIQNLAEYILEYIEVNEGDKSENNIEYLRVNKALLRYCLGAYELEDEKYKRIFDLYLSYGTMYIKQIYSEEFINSEKIFHAKGEEDGFLIYIVRASSIRMNDKVGYIKYLKKALNIFELGRGIKYLIEEFENEENKGNDEMESLLVSFKQSIKTLVQQGKLDEAEIMIYEYEKIGRYDLELVMIKSEIAVEKIKNNKLQ